MRYCAKIFCERRYLSHCTERWSMSCTWTVRSFAGHCGSSQLPASSTRRHFVDRGQFEQYRERKFQHRERIRQRRDPWIQCWTAGCEGEQECLMRISHLISVGSLCAMHSRQWMMIEIGRLSLSAVASLEIEKGALVSFDIREFRFPWLGTRLFGVDYFCTRHRWWK